MTSHLQGVGWTEATCGQGGPGRCQRPRAAAKAAMDSGGVPQHPPTMLLSNIAQPGAVVGDVVVIEAGNWVIEHQDRLRTRFEFGEEQRESVNSLP